MIRVGFVLAEIGSGWLGGVTYYRNLLRAIAASGVAIDPVAVTTTHGSLPDGFPPITTVRTSLVDPARRALLARMAVREILGFDLMLDRFLRRTGIRVLSHGPGLGRRAWAASIAWIPDFQQRHLPQFFSPAEAARRDRMNARGCARATLVIVSSEAARRDLERFHPEAAPRARVLRFVDCSSPFEPATALHDLETRYGFRGTYLHLPNQFWAHKNHRVLIDALHVLRQRGKRVTVLATGNTKDDRRPGFFEELRRHCAERGVEEDLRMLGIVPYEDLAGLLRNAAAVVNPSLFEGWSTTVEEAKSLGKQVLLSDIPVHREQAPDRANYFPPHDPGALADLMWRVWTTYDPSAERQATADAISGIAGRRNRFAAEYEAIVREALVR